MAQALEGIRVLDLSQFLSGPRCGQLLGDMGADVIKIEPPGFGETMRLFVLPIKGMDRALSNWNRNKRGITLNIRHPKGQKLYWKLVEQSDVVIENLAPGLMDRLGLGWEEHRKRNPKIIMCIITGFGQTGPHKDRVAFDLIAQASGGIMHAQKMQDRTPGVFFGDFVGGAYGAVGILQALIARGKTGRGQLVDISMQDVMYFHNMLALDKRITETITESVQESLGEEMADVMTSENRPFPCWYSYKARDGHVAVVILTDRQWDVFMDLIDRPDIKTSNPKYSNLIARVRIRETYAPDFQKWFTGKSAGEIEKILVENKIPCSIVKTLKDVNVDEQLEARGMHAFIEHPRYGKIPTVGIPIRLSDTPGKIRCAAPDLGQHNEEIYRELCGLTPDDLKLLKTEGAI